MHQLPDFFTRHWGLSLLFIVVLAGLIATEIKRLTRKFKQLTPAALTQMINRENAMVVDISPLADFEKGHIPGSHHVAINQFDPESKKLAAVKSLPVVMVCRSGASSQRAAARLVKAGFERVFVLTNGMVGWSQAELPTAKGRK